MTRPVLSRLRNLAVGLWSTAMIEDAPDPRHDPDDEPGETAGLPRPPVPPRPPPPAPPEEPQPLPPDFGDYEFIEMLGKGAFGRVYKVWSLGKCRYEAMKVLHEEAAASRERLEAFKHEVHRMASVPGSLVAHVYHTGALPDGRPFFTMEYLNGGNLDEYCDRSRRSIDDRILAVAAVCDGVHKLHELSLVHCDIKPRNIVVSDDSGHGTPKLVDFGLASHLAFKPSPTKSAHGTLPYMAPEHLSSRGGDPPERGWDIYALGVTLYQLMVGRRPIENFPMGPFSREIYAEHVRRTPIPPLVNKLPWDSVEGSAGIAAQRRLDVAKLRKRLQDPWLEAIICKALAKEREERYASAAEMAQNLRAYVAKRRPPIVPATPLNRVSEFVRDHSRAVAGTAVFIVIAGLLLWVRSARIAERDEKAERLFQAGLAEAVPSLAIDAFQQALELSPTRSEIRLHLAAAHVSYGDAEAAIGIARSITSDDRYYGSAQALIQFLNQLKSVPVDGVPAHAGFEFAPGEEYWCALSFAPEQAESAIVLLNVALANATRFEEQLRVRLALAMRHYQSCDSESLKNLSEQADKLVELADDSPAAWNLKGLGEWKHKRDTSGALDAFSKAIHLNSEYAAPYANRATLRCDRQDYRDALTDWELAVHYEPSLEPWLKGVHIRALFETRREEEAQRECEGLQGVPEVTPRAHIACGNVWQMEGSTHDAWNEFDLAVKASRSTMHCDTEAGFWAIWNRGKSAALLGRYSDALGDLSEAKRLSPDEWRRQPEGARDRGFLFLLTGRSAEALDDLEDVAEASTGGLPASDRARIYLWIWDIHVSHGRGVEAAQALDQAARLANGDRETMAFVAHCAGNVGPEVVLEAAGDDRAEAHYYLGLAAKAQGNPQAAREYFESCLQAGSAEGERLLAQAQVSQLH